ncbi:uncharacterized protein N7443_010355 [Penicillium atrosanguineum]|uniref:uncharacterized protein n=1 Tax=Penicillium atrosanguineum TaxID=1132637 RepID=UPI0023959D98|nr:uncharacterized protein N7443_010355 [Penicillium atrosanguineum]KAJ5290102.1 hypothetical protein N7443_010355 [Penicillium atrosanguineum]
MSESSTESDHLCVLVHGLWGKPSHLDFVASALRDRHGDNIHILSAKENSGHWTYDGIELGGERLAHEIEETIGALDQKGQKIQKLSIVGYSMGGLIARYAIGLLHSQGVLDKLEPVNFTTFATPHVGVRTPLKGLRSQIFNGLGARTISMSGQQLFLIDEFRETGRPLLSVLADPESIFVQGLKKFRHRSVYANIVNDRSVVFYTSALIKVDPFHDLDNININYVKGYDDVIIDRDNYLLPLTPEDPSSESSRFWRQCKAFAFGLPYYLLILILIGPASTIFLANSAVQTIRSRKRIRLHGEGKNGKLFGRYRVPLLVQDVQHAMEDVFENVNARQEPAYLSGSEAEEVELGHASHPKSSGPDGSSKFPTLALSPEQFAIIDSLNAVGFHKYPVHIQKHRHSHAAIIVRMPKDGFAEGKTVIKHWLDNEFLV